MAVRQLQEMGDNLQLIMKRLTSNQKLLKLLYYTNKDPFAQPDITDETIKKEVFNKLIKIIPRLDPKETAKSVISYRVVNGQKTQLNKEFLDIILSFEVFVPLTQWIIKDVSLRPFLIMSEIQKSLEDKTINGLGKMKFESFNLNFLTDEISCYEMMFSIVTYD